MPRLRARQMSSFRWMREIYRYFFASSAGVISGTPSPAPRKFPDARRREVLYHIVPSVTLISNDAWYSIPHFCGDITAQNDTPARECLSLHYIVYHHGIMARGIFFCGGAEMFSVASSAFIYLMIHRRKFDSTSINCEYACGIDMSHRNICQLPSLQRFLIRMKNGYKSPCRRTAAFAYRYQ